MSLLDFPTEKTRASCYACFDMQMGGAGDHECPECGRRYKSRLPARRRPSRPPMFKDTPQ